MRKLWNNFMAWYGSVFNTARKRAYLYVVLFGLIGTLAILINDTAAIVVFFIFAALIVTGFCIGMYNVIKEWLKNRKKPI